MLAAVDDVHHRHRQDMRRDAADIAIQRQRARIRRRLGDREADAEDRVGAEPALVLGAVELDHHLVDLALVLGFEAHHRVGDLAVDAVDRILDALPAPAALVAVAFFDGFVRAGRGARRHRGAAEAAVLEHDIDFDGRIAATVEDRAGMNVDDCGHGTILLTIWTSGSRVPLSA